MLFHINRIEQCRGAARAAYVALDEIFRENQSDKPWGSGQRPVFLKPFFPIFQKIIFLTD